MPKTFVDAIYTAKRLGVQYLWIDSLCIVQDLESDWHRQSAQMDKIYSHSFCNLAAAGARDSTEGFWFKRAPEMVDPGFVSASWLGLDRGRYSLIQRFFWQDLLRHAPVNRRAWVLQERLLAPRVVHFCCRQVAWECQELRACESFQAGIPDYACANEIHFKSLDVQRISKDPRATKYDYASQHIWKQVIEAYTQARLTFRSDKLIALSGIASRIQQDAGSEYMAGLWRSSLPQSLLWRIRGVEESQYRPAPYLAPSWSWLSVEGEICFPEPGGTLEASFIDGRVDLFDENSTGNVTGGFVRLKGRLIPAGCVEGRGQFEILTVPKADIDSWRNISQKNGPEYSLIFWDEHDLNLKPPLTAIFALPICSHDYRDGIPCVLGLVLQQTEQAKNGAQFRRLGLFRIQGKDLVTLLADYPCREVDII
ncbi:MAG: hypothetical protein Q9165_002527 [Trypethelium subeluteriae]